MSKLSVILYITIAIGILFLVSLSPHSAPDPHTHHAPRRGARRLKLRTNFTLPTSKDAIEHHHTDPHHHHEPVPFDPLVADIERHREDKMWERRSWSDLHKYKDFADTAEKADEEAAQEGHGGQPEWEDFMNAEDYINDEERFNITDRLILLFPQLDVDPKDGFVSENELTEWNLQQSMKEVLHRTAREMEIHDKNHDGLVSFQEYDPPSWSKNSGDNQELGYEIGWWKEAHFNASDMNGDGLLNLTEFNDFLHPPDTSNPKLLKWLCSEEIRERDSDKDGKVNFNEFLHGVFDLIRSYDDEDHNSTHVEDYEVPAKKLFTQLDTNSDGFITDDELLPIIGRLHPSERYYAKQQAEHIISQADTDKDGRLSLHEMVENPYAFYSAMFNDDEEDYEDHDELRR